MDISYINSKILLFFKNIYIFLKKSIPARFIIIYFILWLVGCLIISLPWCWNDNRPNSFIDSLFLAGSAFSTTGLTISPTIEMTSFGHAMLFIMILIGGLGVSTLKVMLWVPFRNLSAVKRIEIKDETNLISKNWKKIILCGFLTMLFLYVFGWIILTLHLIYSQKLEIKSSVWYGIFHSVSATANAGFNIMPNNDLHHFREYWIQWLLIFQIVIGGLGFPIIYEFYEYIVWRIKKQKNIILQKHFKFTIYFKIAIIATMALSILSIFVIFLIEFYHQITPSKELSNRIMDIIFHIFSSRAAGFSFIDLNNELSHASQTIIIVLMWIGTLPYSQCGGIKVTTLIICFIGLWHVLKNNNQYHFLKRTISLNNILCSFLIIFGSLIMILLFVIIIQVQQATLSLKEILFETTSAFGTAGLSIIKDKSVLNWVSKLILILTMFVGQINVITLFTLFKKTTSMKRIEYPKENITLF